MSAKDTDERTPEEAERLMNAGLKRALSMPPKPHKQAKKENQAAPKWVSKPS